MGPSSSGHAGGLYVLADVTRHRGVLAEGVGDGRVVCAVGSNLPPMSNAETHITEVPAGTKGRGVDSLSQCDKANQHKI